MVGIPALWPGSWPTLAVPLAALGGGLALLLWGRILHRAALALVGAAVGLALGGGLAAAISVEPLLGRMVGAVVLGLLGLVAARIVWALLAGGLTGAGAAWVMAWLVAGDSPAVGDKVPVAQTATDQAFAEWFKTNWETAFVCLGTVWEKHTAMVVLVLAPAVAVPLIICLIRPRLGRICMTSLLGAGAIVFALLFGASRIQPSLWQAALVHGLWLAGACAVLTIAGLVFQYRGAWAVTAEEEDVEATPVDKGRARGSARKEQTGKSSKGQNGQGSKKQSANSGA